MNKCTEFCAVGILSDTGSDAVTRDCTGLGQIAADQVTRDPDTRIQLWIVLMCRSV